MTSDGRPFQMRAAGIPKAWSQMVMRHVGGMCSSSVKAERVNDDRPYLPHGAVRMRGMVVPNHVCVARLGGWAGMLVLHDARMRSVGQCCRPSSEPMTPNFSCRWCHSRVRRAPSASSLASQNSQRHSAVSSDFASRTSRSYRNSENECCRFVSHCDYFK